MKKGFYFLVFFQLLFLGVIAQETLDTVFVKRDLGEPNFTIDTLFIEGGISSPQVLAGSTFLPGTAGMIKLLNKGISPINFSKATPCTQISKDTYFSNYPRIDEAYRSKDSLVVEITVMSNCCNTFLGDADLDSKDTLQLTYHSYGGFCSCDCIFQLQYIFNTSFENKDEKINWVKINDQVKARITTRNE